MIETGDIVISKAGHDEGRIYVVTAMASGDFALVCDGKYRKLDNPKTKRIKHLKKATQSEKIFELIKNGSLTDADVVCVLNKMTDSGQIC